LATVKSGLLINVYLFNQKSRLAWPIYLWECKHFRTKKRFQLRFIYTGSASNYARSYAHSLCWESVIFRAYETCPNRSRLDCKLAI